MPADELADAESSTIGSDTLAVERSRRVLESVVNTDIALAR